MKRSVYPHTPFYFLLLSFFFFFLKYNVDKKRNDEKGAEDGGMQKSFLKLFYKEREREWVGCNDNGKWRCLGRSAIMNEGECG